MTKPKILTFGCRLNAYESEVMRSHSAAVDLDDAIIINSCAVTSEAERQVRQSIRRARRESPSAKIVVTGCAAQINPEKYAEMPEVDRVIGNREKLNPDIWLGLDETPKISVNDIMTVKDTAPHLISGFQDRVRAFIEIQQGCDHRCTFCIIPYGRGNNRSVPIAKIIEQTRTLVKRGYREVVLTGVDITGYGDDLPGTPQLGEMIKRLLLLVPDLQRLRLSSIDPAEVDGTLFQLIAKESRLMPHFHLSVQSGDDLILKRMKRRHCREDIFTFVKTVRAARPDAVFGGDFIAGFPTESDAAFSRSVSLVEELKLTWLHVFPYSERPGTPAAKMPQLSIEIRKSRAAKLRAIGDACVEQFLDEQIGSTTEVLIEKNGRGRSPQFAWVDVEGDLQNGQLISATIIGRDKETLIARKAE